MYAIRVYTLVIVYVYNTCVTVTVTVSCVYAYECTYMHAWSRSRSRSQCLVCRRVSACTCLQAYMRTQCDGLQKQIRIQVHTCMAYTREIMLMGMSYIHTYIHIYIHTYMYVYYTIPFLQDHHQYC